MTPYAATHARPQGGAEAWTCRRCGADLEGACEPLQAKCDIGPEIVIHRLERAGATLLAMRTRSPMPAPYRCALPDALKEAVISYGWTPVECPPPIPNAAAISRMEATWQWLSYVPDARYTLRRIVAVRSLIDPVTLRHRVHWRALGRLLHCSHEACRLWHRQGIDLIVDRLSVG